MSDLQVRTELVERALGRHLAWIAAADAKVAPILAIDSAMLAVLAAVLPSASKWSAVEAIVAACSAALLVVSVALLAAAAFPRTDGPKGSAVFFGAIASQDERAFVARLQGGHTEAYLEDLARQCYRNAEIATAKYRYLRFAMLAVFMAVLPWLVTIALLYRARA